MSPFEVVMRKLWLLVIIATLMVSSFSAAKPLHLAQTDSTIDVNFGGSTTQNYSNTTSIKPSLPDIGTYVDNNVSDFSVNGASTYTGADIITGISNTFYTLNISLITIDVINDHDTIGDGNIFIEGTANGNKTRYPASGNEWSIASGATLDTNVGLVFTTAYQYNITFEVRDADSGQPDDSLGFVTAAGTISNTTQVLTTDLGDAILTFNFTAYEKTSITAQEVLDGSRPYLNIDDETSQTELPNDLLGRIIIGPDGGHQAMVLQYFFYWNYEYSPDGGVYSFELKKNDFEAFYIYYDLNDFSDPYRIVFNNYIYSDVPGFPNQNLLILEDGATDTTLNFTTTMQSDLQLLLGVTTQQEARYLPMSALNNWEYNSLLNQKKNVRTSSLLGSTTVELTVDTSYHTFDLGPGGNEYGFNYNTTSSLNDTRIKSLYSIIEDTFNNGTRNWSYFGIDIPEVGPFTFDVTQVFSAPHVITGYSTVSKDTAAVERARNSYLNVTQSLDVTIGYNFPSKLDVHYPDEMSTGSSAVASLTYTPSDKLQISVGFDYHLDANMSFWLVQASISQDFNHTFTFDIDSATVSSLAQILNLNGFELDDQNLFTFLDLTGLTINPKLFGTMIEGSLVLDLWGVIDSLIRPSYPLAVPVLDAIDYLIDDFSLNLDFAVAGVVSVPVSTSDSAVTLNTSEIVFTEDKLTQYVEITTSDQISADFNLVIGDISYGLNFSVDWNISFAFDTPLSQFVGDLGWDIGVFPNYTSNLISSPGATVSVSLAGLPTTTGSTTTSNPNPNNSPTDNGTTPVPIFMIGISIISIAVISRRRRN